jgi:hypothetical protein
MRRILLFLHLFSPIPLRIQEHQMILMHHYDHLRTDKNQKINRNLNTQWFSEDGNRTQNQAFIVYHLQFSQK